MGQRMWARGRIRIPASRRDLMQHPGHVARCQSGILGHEQTFRLECRAHRAGYVLKVVIVNHYLIMVSAWLLHFFRPAAAPIGPRCDSTAVCAAQHRRGSPVSPIGPLAGSSTAPVQRPFARPIVHDRITGERALASHPDRRKTRVNQA